MMKPMSVLPLLLFAPAAWAQATPEGAATLTAVFQTYVGSVPGVVTVTPAGGDYLLKLDAAPLIAQVPAEANVALSVTPLEMTLTDKGDGTWIVTQDQPLSFALSSPGEIDMTVSLAALSCEGIFDTALMAMSANACEARDLAVTQTIVDPDTGTMDVAYTATSLTLETSAVAGARGGVDGTTAYTITGLDERFSLPMQPGAAPQPLRVTIADYSLEGTSTGFRPDAFLKLIAWLVAHPDEAAMMADRAGLKAILADGLPLFEEIVASSTGTGLVVETPIGPFSLSEVGIDVQLRGAMTDGLFREAIRFSGLTAPKGVLPPFAEPLIPERFGIDVTVQSFDAAAAVQLLIGLLDLPVGVEPGPEFEGAFLAALMPQGTVGIVLAPGEIGNAMYALEYQGEMTAGPSVMPVGKGRITATGFDDAVAVLDGAPQEVKSEILPVMGIARGLARPGPDGQLVWEIDGSTPGTLLINGLDLMAMQP